MPNNWLFFSNLDTDGGYHDLLSSKPNLTQGLGAHFLSHFGSILDISFNHSNQFIESGSSALQESFSFLSKAAGTIFIWSSTKSKSNKFSKLSRNSQGSCNGKKVSSSAQYKLDTALGHKPSMVEFGFGSEAAIFTKLASSTLNFLYKQVRKNHAFTILSLAVALVPPFDNLSPKVLANAIQMEYQAGEISNIIKDTYRGCDSLSMSKVLCVRDAIEPKTGIMFPTILDASFNGENCQRPSTEVLVGTGSRSMRILKIKTLRIYAFGLYVQPDSACKKLGPKYANVPADELKDRSDFYEDILREDINMTVRLVISCNGLKINNVRDAFENSLRTRLQKINPTTDYSCLRKFGSYFQQEIPLPAGTAINFRQTIDGQLITEIGGKLIGTVHSKDLCRAFFDMYIGNAPVSLETKQDIAQNVANLVTRC